MGRYLIRRLLVSVVSLIAISMVVFGILAIAPGDPLSGFATNPNVPPELRQRIRASMGLDDPIPVQYARWASSYVQGDWMVSYTAKIPVRDYVMSRIPVTLMITGSAFLVSILVAIPIGVISALKQYSLFDQVATTFAFFGFSIPTFFSGLLLILLFSVKLQWLPFVYDGNTTDPLIQLKQMIMPVAVLALFQAATLARFVRASMLDNMGQDYVRTARAKGIKETAVVVRHVLRNALFPVVTLIALQLPNVFTGAVVTEQIFRVPGMGALLIKSIQDGDTPVVMGIVLLFSILVVIMTLVADILYGLLDPRVKYS